MTKRTGPDGTCRRELVPAPGRPRGVRAGTGSGRALDGPRFPADDNAGFLPTGSRRTRVTYVPDESLRVKDMAEHVAYEAFMLAGTTQLIEQGFPANTGFSLLENDVIGFETVDGNPQTKKLRSCAAFIEGCCYQFYTRSPSTISSSRENAT